VSNAKTDPHRLPSVTGAEANQARKAQYIPTRGWTLGLLAAVVIIVLIAALH
jgi:hypothetical protein